MFAKFVVWINLVAAILNGSEFIAGLETDEFDWAACLFMSICSLIATDAIFGECENVRKDN